MTNIMGKLYFIRNILGLYSNMTSDNYIPYRKYNGLTIFYAQFCMLYIFNL